MQSIYWVITRNCTQRCDHCYIGSGPGEESLSEADVERIVEHLPQQVGQVIIAGGETLTVKPLLFHALKALSAKYEGATRFLMQTNGDLLDERIIAELFERGLSRIDVSSIDSYHHNRHDRERIDAFFRACGATYLEFPIMVDEEKGRQGFNFI